MENINSRIGILLDKLKITKTAFAESLKVSQQYISKLTKEGNPSNLLIDDICKKYSVSEEWLRTGKGEMFVTLNEEDEYMRAATEISMSGDEFAMRAIIEYWKLDEESKQLFRDFLSRIATKKE